MELKDVKQFIEENREDQDVQEFLSTFTQEIKVDAEVIQRLVEEDESVKAVIDSMKDKHTNKALDTWKTNNLERLIGEEVRKRYPEKDERDIALQKLEAKIVAMEQEKTYEKLRNVALRSATEKGLPIDLVEYFIGDNEDSTVSNLGKLEQVFNNSLEESVRARLKDTSYTPPKSTPSKDYTVEQMGEMSADEINTIIEAKTRPQGN